MQGHLMTTLELSPTPGVRRLHSYLQFVCHLRAFDFLGLLR